jgi:hypothetical protein
MSRADARLKRLEKKTVCPTCKRPLRGGGEGVASEDEQRRLAAFRMRYGEAHPGGDLTLTPVDIIEAQKLLAAAGFEIARPAADLTLTAEDIQAARKLLAEAGLESNPPAEH